MLCMAACAGTTILVEVPAGNDADAVAAAVERVFAGGLAMGVFLSTRKDSVSETVTVDDVSADLAACARVASARCPKVSANRVVSGRVRTALRAQALCVVTLLHNHPP
jgi:hypothetical protein